MYSYIKTFIKNLMAKEISYAGLILLIAFFYHLNNQVALLYASIFLMLMGVALFPFERVFLIFTILVPNLTMFKVSNDSAALFGYVFLAVEFKFFLKRWSSGIKVPICIWLHFFFAVISCVIYWDMSLFTMMVRGTFLLFFFYTLSKDVCLTDLYRKKIIGSYVLGCVLAILMGILYRVLMGRVVFNGFFAAINAGRNYFASILLSAITLSLLALHTTNKNIPMYTVAIVISLLGGFASGSRTFFLALFLVAFLVVKLFFSKKGKTIFLFLIVASALFYLGRRIFLSHLDYIWERMGDDTAASGNGRFNAWSFYLKEVFSSLPTSLFGIGSTIKYVNAGEALVVEHNTFMQALCAFGLLGVFSLLQTYVWIARRVAGRIRGIGISYWIPLLCTLFCYFGISAVHSDQFNFAIFLSLLGLTFSDKEREEAVAEL